MCFIYVVADVVNILARMLGGGVVDDDDKWSGVASTEEDPDADGSELAAAVQEAAKAGNVGYTDADVSKFQHNVNRGNFVKKLAQPAEAHTSVFAFTGNSYMYAGSNR